jgi:hypothetical protein
VTVLPAQPPAALMQPCSTLPPPSGDTLGDILNDEIALASLYGQCAKQVADWVQWTNGAEATN